jgi:uncharacterized protein YidB (DUF937 family)
METSTQKLTTPTAILTVFDAVATDAAIDSKPDSNELLKDLATLFLAKPIKAIASSLQANPKLVHDALEKMFNLHPNGSEERKAVVATGVSLVDDFVKAGQLDAADAWLEMGYRVYAAGSEEEKAVVAKGVSLVDEFIKAGNLDTADAWLVRRCNLHPNGSEEEKTVVTRQEQIRHLRSSIQIGAAPKIDITGLRTVVKEELAKLRVAGVGH